MNELKVIITPATISANFDELHAYLTVEVEKYDVEVFSHNVKDAKKLATELNAVTKGINTVKKTQLEILEAPAKEFKAQIAELNDIVQTGRTKILNQVKFYEDKTKDEVKVLLETLLEEELIINELVGKDYTPIFVDDLILLGSITENGNLAKKAKDEVKLRVATEVSKLRAVEMRLLQLENECYKAGLKVPLAPEYLNDFIRAEDDIYKAQLERLIRIELDRQKYAEEEARKIADYEAQKLIDKANQINEAKLKAQAEENDKRIAENQTETAVKEEKTIVPTQSAPEGKKYVNIVIRRQILVRDTASETKILLKIRELEEEIGAISYIGIE